MEYAPYSLLKTNITWKSFLCRISPYYFIANKQKKKTILFYIYKKITKKPVLFYINKKCIVTRDHVVNIKEFFSVKTTRVACRL